MVQPIPMFNQPEVKILESQIRECFGRVVWTHKTHEKCSDIYAEQLKSLKTKEILLYLKLYSLTQLYLHKIIYFHSIYSYLD